MDKIVICKKCGAMVKVLIDCTCENCGIKCCGDIMQEISEEEAKKIFREKIIFCFLRLLSGVISKNRHNEE